MDPTDTEMGEITGRKQNLSQLAELSPRKFATDQSAVQKQHTKKKTRKDKSLFKTWS